MALWRGLGYTRLMEAPRRLPTPANPPSVTAPDGTPLHGLQFDAGRRRSPRTLWLARHQLVLVFERAVRSGQLGALAHPAAPPRLIRWSAQQSLHRAHCLARAQVPQQHLLRALSQLPAGDDAAALAACALLTKRRRGAPEVLLAWLRQRGQAPTDAVFRAMVRGAIMTDGHVDTEVLDRVPELMRESGVQPSAATLGAIITANAVARRPQQCEQAVAALTAAGQEVPARLRPWLVRARAPSAAELAHMSPAAAEQFVCDMAAVAEEAGPRPSRILLGMLARNVAEVAHLAPGAAAGCVRQWVQQVPPRASPRAVDGLCAMAAALARAHELGEAHSLVERALQLAAEAAKGRPAFQVSQQYVRSVRHALEACVAAPFVPVAGSALDARTGAEQARWALQRMLAAGVPPTREAAQALACGLVTCHSAHEAALPANDMPLPLLRALEEVARRGGAAELDGALAAVLAERLPAEMVAAAGGLAAAVTAGALAEVRRVTEERRHALFDPHKGLLSALYVTDDAFVRFRIRPQQVRAPEVAAACSASLTTAFRCCARSPHLICCAMPPRRKATWWPCRRCARCGWPRGVQSLRSMRRRSRRHWSGTTWAAGAARPARFCPPSPSPASQRCSCLRCCRPRRCRSGRRWR